MSKRFLAVLLIVPGLLVASAARAQSKSDDTPPAKSAGQDSEDVAPPIPLPSRTTAPANPVNPWWVRPSLTLTAGKAAEWSLTIYGFAEADMMGDSTRSFNDGLNNNVIAHNDTQAGDNTRAQFTIRNSRIGFKAAAPPIGGITATGLLELDMFGNQPSINGGGGSGQAGQAVGPGYTTEAAYFNNAAPRIRHAYVELKSPVVNVLAGQAYRLLGWQNYFFGATCAFLGLPNELFNRTVQLRLSHTFETDPVNIDVAVAALRPAQRDSATPDVEGGVRLAFNHWKGMTTPGSGGTGALPLAIGVSGLARQFRVDPYAPLRAPPIPLVGWAVAGDVLLPIIPVRDSTDRGNALTFTAEFVMGTGDADQYTGMTAGATMPNVYPLNVDTPVNAMGAASPQVSLGAQPVVGLPYTPDVDPGMVAFDTNGLLHTINWRTVVAGFQYYLPPTGRVFITGNYSRGASDNIAGLYHPYSPTQPWVNAQAVFKSSWYVDGNIFFDVTPAARVGLSFQRVNQVFADGTSAYNNRYEMTWLYFF